MLNSPIKNYAQFPHLNYHLNYVKFSNKNYARELLSNDLSEGSFLMKSEILLLSSLIEEAVDQLLRGTDPRLLSKIITYFPDPVRSGFIGRAPLWEELNSEPKGSSWAPLRKEQSRGARREVEGRTDGERKQSGGTTTRLRNLYKCKYQFQINSWCNH